MPSSIKDQKALIKKQQRLIEQLERENHLLLEKKDYPESIIRSSVDGILAFDKNCNYTLWNPGMERISGVKKSKTLGKSAFNHDEGF